MAIRYMLLGCLAMICANANGQQTSNFQIGDVVEIQVRNRVVHGEVVEFVGPGKWLRVKYRFVNSEQFQDVMPQKAKRIDTLESPITVTDAADRTWTDSTGKFQIEARLTELKATEVTIEKKDRSLVTLALDKLSPEDQVYLRSFAAQRYLAQAAEISRGNNSAMPLGQKGQLDQNELMEQQRDEVMRRAGIDPEKFKREMEANFGFDDFPRNGLPGSGPQNPRKPAANGATKLSEPVKVVSLPEPLAVHVDRWTYVPAVAPNPPPDWLNKTIEISSFGSQFGMSQQMNDDPFCRMSGVGPVFSFFDPSRPGSNLIIFDTKSSNVIGRGSNEVTVGAAVSPSGKLRVYCLSDPGQPPLNGLDLRHSYTESTRRSLSSEQFTEFVNKERIKSLQVDPTVFSGMPTFVTFLSEDHILTVGKKIILWDIAKDQANYVIELFPKQMAYSRDMKHAAIFAERSVWLLELMTGKLVGQVKLDAALAENLSALDFSSDGHQLIAAAGKTIYGWNLTNGTNEFEFDAKEPVNRLMWVDNAFVLVNNQTLYEPKTKLVVWNFSTGIGNLLSVGNANWFVSPSGIRMVEIIDANRRTQIKRIIHLTNNPVEKPDVEVKQTRIALKTDFRFLGRDAQRAQTGLEKLLTDNNYILDDNAPLVLHAVIKREPEVTEDINPREARVRVRYHPHLSEMYLISAGRQVWHHSRRDTVEGPRIALFNDETVQEAVDRLSGPKVSFFLNAPIPGVSRPVEDGLGPGRSIVSHRNGIK